MKILFLGGTQFVGRAMVEAALERDCEITVFHRGRHTVSFGKGVQSIHGDRATDLHLLDSGDWDAVIDTSGYVRNQVRAAVDRLAGRVRVYTFISTISVYADFGEHGITEGSALQPPDERDQEWTAATYGPMKVACEAAVREGAGEAHLVIRPGIIVGPEDYTDRFPYWCRRIAAGGEVLCAGSPDRPVQWIDARDLGAWTVEATLAGLCGTFNATGPEHPTSIGQMLEGIRRATGSDARLTWVDDRWLGRHDLDPGPAFPFYVPEERAGIFAVDSSAARAAGLDSRPLSASVRDTLEWDRKRPLAERRERISAEREAELLRRWHAR
jgi:2'-hydroxyisoflavone reductase